MSNEQIPYGQNININKKQFGKDSHVYFFLFDGKKSKIFVFLIKPMD